jgi:hypothetical protein
VVEVREMWWAPMKTVKNLRVPYNTENVFTIYGSIFFYMEKDPAADATD